MTTDPQPEHINSPSIAAAVAEERRFTNLEVTLEVIKETIKDGFQNVNNRLDIANGRTTKNEAAIAKVERTLDIHVVTTENTSLIERVETLEDALSEDRLKQSYTDGISDGKVQLRMGDKAAFAVVMGLITLIINLLVQTDFFRSLLGG
jgi:hypothetical protein